MMKVTVLYHAQTRAAAGTARETVEAPSPCTAGELLARLAERHGPALGKILLTGNGKAHPSILLFVAEQQVGAEHALRDGDVLAMLSPISGG